VDRFLISLWVGSVVVSVVFATALPVVFVSAALALAAALRGRRSAY
jgi:hypothetical protein